jgi:hypothetical protein
MAGDWIRMRVSLARDPAIVAVADFLAEQREFMDWLTDPVRQHCSETAYEHVTRNVTVAVTVNALLAFWGVANEVGHPDGDDLLLRHATLESVDEACGVPCFGLALQSVDWAIEENSEGRNILRLPKFLINNVPAGDRTKKTNAERQKRFREKQALLDNDQSNVTRNVTVTHRIEKKREEKKEKQKQPRTKEKDLTLAEWVLALPDDEEVIVDSDPIFDWALKIGVPREWVALAWFAFESRYGDNPKRYTDWRAVFRKALREDWLKLWRKDSRTGGWVLTPAGEMAERERQS